MKPSLSVLPSWHRLCQTYGKLQHPPEVYDRQEQVKGMAWEGRRRSQHCFHRNPFCPYRFSPSRKKRFLSWARNLGLSLVFFGYSIFRIVQLTHFYALIAQTWNLQFFSNRRRYILQPTSRKTAAEIVEYTAKEKFTCNLPSFLVSYDRSGHISNCYCIENSFGIQISTRKPKAWLADRWNGGVHIKIDVRNQAKYACHNAVVIDRQLGASVSPQTLSWRRWCCIFSTTDCATAASTCQSEQTW